MIERELRERYTLLFYFLMLIEGSRDNTSLWSVDWWKDCDIRRSGLDWHSTTLWPGQNPPPHALQSSWLHQQGITLSCRSKRNRSSYLHMDESRIAARKRYDRLKRITEWTKSELFCAVTVRRTSHTSPGHSFSDPASMYCFPNTNLDFICCQKKKIKYNLEKKIFQIVPRKWVY